MGDHAESIGVLSSHKCDYLHASGREIRPAATPERMRENVSPDLGWMAVDYAVMSRQYGLFNFRDFRRGYREHAAWRTLREGLIRHTADRDEWTPLRQAS